MSSIRAPGLHEDPIRHLTRAALSVPVTGLGESIHHTAEHPALRRAFLDELLERCGSLVVALEAVPPGPNPIDDYVTAGADSDSAAAALIATGVRMWGNRPMSELVETLRRHNDAQGRRIVRVRGIDVLTPGLSMSRVLSSPAVTASDAVRQELIAATLGLRQDGVRDQLAYDALPPATVQQLRAVVDEALIRLAHDEQSLRDRLGDLRFAALRRDAVTARRSLTTLSAGRGNWLAGLPARDHAMAENVADLVRAGGAERLVVLGHNSHIAAAPPIPTGPAGVGPTASGPAEPMGGWLRRWFGRDYLAVGTTVGAAHFAPPIYGATGLAPDGAGDERSIDAIIAARTDRPAWVTPRESSATTGTRLRSIGTHEPAYRLDEAFDALIHLPALSTAEQLVPVSLDLSLPA